MPLRAHSRRTSPENIQRRVVIRVRREAAMPTPEDRLALAALGVNDPTFRTGLRSVCGRYLDQRPAALLKLVCKDGLECIPALVQDCAIEPRLLSDALTGRIDRSSSARRHCRNSQAFHSSSSKPLCQRQCGPMVPVFSDARYLGRKPRDATLGLHATVRPALLASHGALGSPLAALDYGHRSRQREHFTGRERQCVRHAAVNPYAGKPGRLDVCCDLAREGYVPAQCIAREGNILGHSLKLAGIPEFHPSDLWQPNLRPLCIQFAGGDILRHETDAGAVSQASRRWILAAAVEEVVESTIQVPQCLFLAHPFNRCDPLKLSPKCRQLSALRRKADAPAGLALVLPPEVSALLPSEIVNQSAHATELRKALGLFGRWRETIAKASKHGEFVP